MPLSVRRPKIGHKLLPSLGKKINTRPRHPAKCLDCGRPRAFGCGHRCKACYGAFVAKGMRLYWKRRRTRLYTAPVGTIDGPVDMASIFTELDRVEAKALAAIAQIKKGPAG